MIHLCVCTNTIICTYLRLIHTRVAILSFYSCNEIKKLLHKSNHHHSDRKKYGMKRNFIRMTNKFTPSGGMTSTTIDISSFTVEVIK